MFDWSVLIGPVVWPTVQGASDIEDGYDDKHCIFQEF